MSRKNFKIMGKIILIVVVFVNIFLFSDNGQYRKVEASSEWEHIYHLWEGGGSSSWVFGDLETDTSNYRYYFQWGRNSSYKNGPLQGTIWDDKNNLIFETPLNELNYQYSIYTSPIFDNLPSLIRFGLGSSYGDDIGGTMDIYRQSKNLSPTIILTQPTDNLSILELNKVVEKKI
jgi:hypothetical protein